MLELKKKKEEKGADILGADPPLKKEDILEIFQLEDEDQQIATDICEAFNVGKSKIVEVSQMEEVKNWLSNQFDVLGIFSKKKKEVQEDKTTEEAITFNEFAVLTCLLANTSNEDKLVFLFKYFDVNGDHRLQKKELKALMRAVRASVMLFLNDGAMSVEQAKDLVTSVSSAAESLLRHADEDGDEQLTRYEFVEAAQTGNGKIASLLTNLMEGGNPTQQTKMLKKAKDDNIFRIVSIDGGGIRALMSVAVLTRLDQIYPNFCGNVDMFAGSGNGAIIASLLAMGYPPKAVLDIYLEEVPAMFKKARKALFELAPGPKYNREPLLELLKQKLGSVRMRHVTAMNEQAGMPHLVIPTFHLGQKIQRTEELHWGPRLYHSLRCSGPKEPEYDAMSNSLLSDILAATTAAPTFFEPYQNQLDGSLCQNNPSAAALSLVLSPSFDERSKDDIRLLSLGNGFFPHKATEEQFSVGKKGLILSGSIKDLLSAMMEGSTQANDALCETLLRGDKYFRMDPDIVNAMNERVEVPLDSHDIKDMTVLLNSAQSSTMFSALKQWIDRSDFLRSAKTYRCTFSETGRTYKPQKMYVCTQCEILGTDGLGLCEPCFLGCHKDHKGAQKYTDKDVPFFCKCGHRTVVGTKGKYGLIIEQEAKTEKDEIAELTHQYKANGIKYQCESLPDGFLVDKCTYYDTGAGAATADPTSITQRMYVCYDCEMDDEHEVPGAPKLGLCYVCVRQCHAHHKTALKDPRAKGFVCMCGHFSCKSDDPALDKYRLHGLKNEWYCEATNETMPGMTTKHEHPLFAVKLDDGWVCNGVTFMTGCKRKMKGNYESKGVRRMRCMACNFDLCDACFEAYRADKEEEEDKSLYEQILASMEVDRKEREMEQEYYEKKRIVLPKWPDLRTYKDIEGIPLEDVGTWTAVKEGKLPQFTYRLGWNTDGAEVYAARALKDGHKVPAVISHVDGELKCLLASGTAVEEVDPSEFEVLVMSKKEIQRTFWVKSKAGEEKPNTVSKAGIRGAEPLYFARRGGFLCEFCDSYMRIARATDDPPHCLECKEECQRKQFWRCFEYCAESRKTGLCVPCGRKKKESGQKFGHVGSDVMIYAEAGDVLRDENFYVLAFHNVWLPQDIGTGIVVVLQVCNTEWFSPDEFQPEVLNAVQEKWGSKVRVAAVGDHIAGVEEIIEVAKEVGLKYGIISDNGVEEEKGSHYTNFGNWVKANADSIVIPYIFVFNHIGGIAWKGKQSDFTVEVVDEVFREREEKEKSATTAKDIAQTTTNPKVRADYLARVIATRDIDRLKEHLASLGPKIDINFPDLDKFSPICLGVKTNNPAIVRVLLDHKGDVDDRDSDGMTPLHLAVKTGSLDIVTLLVEKKASLSAKTIDEKEWTARELAIDLKNDEIAKYLAAEEAKAKAEKELSKVAGGTLQSGEMEKALDSIRDNSSTSATGISSARTNSVVDGVRSPSQAKSDKAEKTAQEAQEYLDSKEDGEKMCRNCGILPAVIELPEELGPDRDFCATCAYNKLSQGGDIDNVVAFTAQVKVLEHDVAILEPLVKRHHKAKDALKQAKSNLAAMQDKLARAIADKERLAKGEPVKKKGFFRSSKSNTPKNSPKLESKKEKKQREKEEKERLKAEKKGK